MWGFRTASRSGSGFLAAPPELLVLGVLLFDDSLPLGDDLCLNVRWHRLVLAELHREGALTGRDGAQLGRVVQHRRERHLRLDGLDPVFDLHPGHATTLSEKRADGGWDADTDRLLLMDRRDFNQVGLGPDDLLEAYIQSVLSVLAIDRMADNLCNRKTGSLRRKLFQSLNDDPALLNEVTR